ncbi:MAG TPA: methyltransferase [Caulobacterales bacterium]|nr:methyltransferase [Caulobacterales bacterium]
MKRTLILSALAAALIACSPAAPTATTTAATTSALAPEPVSALQSDVAPDAAYITAAIASARRPADDKARDAARHPAETLALSGVKPGWKIGEILPGEGYFTRLFSLSVGRGGHVFTIVRPHASQYEHPVAEDMGNVTTVIAQYTNFTFPEPVDLIFTAQNYHDLQITSYSMGNPVDMDRAAFAALKPGGYFVVIDHSAIAGSAVDQAHPLHRGDQDAIRREIESVGFVYDGESQILRNADDPRTQNVFDPAIRGHTDQFFMRFRKPAT